jgi:hypothetical protein
VSTRSIYNIYHSLLNVFEYRCMYENMIITIFLSCSNAVHYSSECVHHRVNNTKKPNQICFLDSFMRFDAMRHHFPSGFSSGETLLKIPLVEDQTSRLTEKVNIPSD